jgi:PAS domain S-box-containing protein
MSEQIGVEVQQRFTKIAMPMFTKIGTDFFHQMTKHLAKELDADSVYVGEFLRGPAEQVRTLALCVDGDVKANLEFPITGSPEAEVARGDPSIHLSDIQSMFPSDLMLSELKAQACVELPLIDSEQRRLGLIGVFYRHPLREVELVQSLLAMCVPRVLAELNRKQSEETLRESEQRYRAFVGLNRDPMCVEFSEPIAIDRSEDDQVESIIQTGRVAECNDALARMLNKENPEQLVGGALFQILPPDLLETYRKSTESMVRSGYRFDDTREIEIQGKDGKPRWFLRTHWGIVENRKLRRIWGLHREITDLREAQMKLVTSEKQLSELVETLHLAAIELDRDLALSYCNDYLLKLTGWRQEEIIGKKWFDKMVPPEEREKLRALFSTRTKVPIHFDGTLVCRDRHRLLVGWDYVVIRDRDGHIVNRVGSFRDLIDYADLGTLPPHSIVVPGFQTSE